MEDTQKRNGIQKQPKFAINLGRGGGGIGIGIGIGVGIILVGGALVANAFQKKQSNSKPNTCKNIKKNNEKTPQDNSNLLGANHSSSYIHKHLTSDGMDMVNKSGDDSMPQNLLQQEDVKCDDQEISSFCSKDSEHQSNECNVSVVPTEEELSSENYHHRINADQVTEESHQTDQSEIGVANTEMLSSTGEISATETGEPSSKCGQDDHLLAFGSIDDQVDEDKMSGGINDSQDDVTQTAVAVEVESFKAPNGEKQLETPEVTGDKIHAHARIIGTGEAVDDREAENEVQIDATGKTVNQDCNDVLLTTLDARVLDAVELLKAPKTENQINEVLEEKQAQDSTVTNAIEEDVEEIVTQHDVQTDVAGQVIPHQGCNHEVFDELFKARKTNIQLETPEVIDDKIHAQNDLGIEQTSKLNECQSTADQESADAIILDAVESLKEPKTENQTNEAAEVIEEKEAQVHTLTNATEEEVEEKETQHDVQTDAAGQVILDVFDADDLLEATKIQPETLSVEDEDRYGIQINAAEGNIHARIIGTEEAVEEGKGQDEVRIDATGLEIDSGSEQTSQLDECPPIVVQDSNHVLLTTSDDGVLNAVELLKATKTENQINETVEVNEQKKDQDCTLTNATEEDVEEQETQHDVLTDAAGQVIVDQGCNHGEFVADELLEAPNSKIQPETHTVEGKEAQYDVQINAVGGESEEKKDQHDAKVNAIEVIEENKAQDCTVTNAKEEEVEEKGTELDVQTDAAGKVKVILDQGCNHELLDIADAGAFGADELLEAPKTKMQPETNTVEGKETHYDFQINTAEGEENKDQHDAQTNEAVEVIVEKEAQDCTLTNATEEEVEEKETQHNVQTDAAGQGCNHEVFDADELLEALKDKIQPETHTVEGKEAQCDVHMNVAGQESEEKKNQHDAKINAAEEVIEDKEAQHYSCCNLGVQINAAETNSGSEQTSNLIELQKVPNQVYSNHISHQMTSENILHQENEQNMSQLNPVMGLKGEFEDGDIDLHSSKTNTEFISIETSAEEVDGDDPQVQSTVEAQLSHQETEKSLQEFHDISRAADTIIEDHLVKSITGEKVEESSDRSVDSLVESTSEPVLTAESVQEVVPIQDTKEILIIDEKEKLEVSVTQLKMEKVDGANDEKESSNMNLVKKYMLKLAEQNAEQKGLLMRNRTPIVIGTMSALLCPLCHWYFGLPLVKICLIAVLVMLLSKIQGF